MSDEDKRREEERKRFETLRSLDTEGQESPLPRRRLPAGTQPFGQFPGYVGESALSRSRRLTQVISSDTPPQYRRQQYSRYGGPSPPKASATASASAMSLRRPDTGGHRIQPIPSEQQTQIPQYARQEPSRAQQTTNLGEAWTPRRSILGRSTTPPVVSEEGESAFPEWPPRETTGESTDPFAQQPSAFAQHLSRSRSVGDIPDISGLNLGQTQVISSDTPPQFRRQQYSRYGGPSPPKPSAPAPASAMSLRRPPTGGHRIQPIPSGQQTQIPQYARQEPIPEPPIVLQYRDPITGEPSMERLRKPHPQREQLGLGMGGPIPSTEMGAYLANLSRQNITLGILAPEQAKSGRQRNKLIDRGFRRVRLESGRERYVPKSSSTSLLQSRPRSRLLPQTRRDMANVHDPRFNRPIREMERRQVDPQYDDTLAPVGRQQWGAQPLRKAYSLPDLSDPNLVADINETSRMEHFEDRFEKLPTDDRESYRQFRKLVSWRSNPLARSRMVKPPTIGNIRDADHKRLSQMSAYRKQMMQYRVGEVSADKLRQSRRDYVRKKAYMPSAIPEDKRRGESRPFSEIMRRAVQQEIPEILEEEDDDEEEEQ